VAVCDHVEGVPDGIDPIVTAHAVPDQSSVAAGNRLLDPIAGVEKGCHVLFLISGGGSSLVETPAEGDCSLGSGFPSRRSTRFALTCRP
jgi:glycerate-2-kinase